MSELKDLEEYLEIQNPKVIKHVTVIEAGKLGQSFMLHIDKETPKYFEPRIGKSFSDDEDNTLPRITVSDSVLGCIIGYYRFLKDFLEPDDETSTGYDINLLDFTYCVKPSDELVPYASAANEYWLIGYNKEHLRYTPRTIGKLFIQSVEHVAARNGHDIKCVFYVEIQEDDWDIPFSKNKKLRRGYYRITGDLSDYNSNNDNDGSDSLHHDDLKLFDIKKIHKDDYRKTKRASIVMLDTSNISIPIFTRW